MEKRGSRPAGGARKKILEVEDLHVAVEGREILHGVDLEVMAGEVVAIEGVNGSGKSTLVQAVMGLLPVLSGKMKFKGRDLQKMSIDERARAGLFLAWQNPPELAGVQFRELCGETEMLPVSMQLREVYVGWSGGEKKRGELAQMIAREPELAMLDEVDSGLDRRAAKEISREVAEWQKKTGAALIVISHNKWLLEELEVGRTYTMEDGRCLLKK